MISHDKAIEIIKQHGWDSPYQPTCWQSRAGGKDGHWVEGTSFYDEMGIKKEYDRSELAQWLGY